MILKIFLFIILFPYVSSLLIKPYKNNKHHDNNIINNVVLFNEKIYTEKPESLFYTRNNNTSVLPPSTWLDSEFHSKEQRDYKHHDPSNIENFIAEPYISFMNTKKSSYIHENNFYNNPNETYPFESNRINDDDDDDDNENNKILTINDYANDNYNFTNEPIIDSISYHEQELERLLASYTDIKHPLYPYRSLWLWKYQFLLIISSLALMYLIQMILDIYATKKLLSFSRLATCVFLGANFIPIQKLHSLHYVRLATCLFIHGHIFHLASNVISIVVGWVYLSHVPFIIQNNVWIYHWTFPMFMITGFFGSMCSYITTLKDVTISIGASGGCLGLVTAFITSSTIVSGVAPYQRTNLLFMIGWVIMNCIPLERLCRTRISVQPTDVNAHASGALSGIILGLLLGIVMRTSIVSLKAMILASDILCIILLIFLGIAYIELIREYFIDGRQMYIQLLEKQLEFDKNETRIHPGDRRHTIDDPLETLFPYDTRDLKTVLDHESNIEDTTYPEEAKPLRRMTQV